MSNEVVRIFIGTEPNQYIAQQVLANTIRKCTTGPVEINFCTQDQARVGGTNFGLVRFTIPSRCNFEGKAIYIDADQIVFEDLRNLLNTLKEPYAVALVQEPEGYFGEKKVEKMNQTSVMVLDCAKLRSWDPETMFNNVVPNRQELKPGQIHYRDFMCLSWFDQSQIQAIDPRWNHFNVIRDDSKLTHFSHVRTQPWKNPSHPLAKEWENYLRKTVKDNDIGRMRIVSEVIKRHVHPGLLKHAVSL